MRDSQFRRWLIMAFSFAGVVVALLMGRLAMRAETRDHPSSLLRVVAPTEVAVGQPFTVTMWLEESVALDIAAYETTLLFDISAAHVRAVTPVPAAPGLNFLALGPVEMPDGVALGAYRCLEPGCRARAGLAAAPIPEGLALASFTLVGDKPGRVEFLLAQTLVVDQNGASAPLQAKTLSFTVTVEQTSQPYYPAPAIATDAAHLPNAPAALDITGDGAVDARDHAEVVLAWAFTRAQGNRCSVESRGLPDLNGDRCLDVLDFSPIMAARLTSNASQPPPATAASSDREWIVDTVADDPDETPGDGICQTEDEQCSLRAAIVEANANPGADTIHFALSDDGIQTIQLKSPLPTLNDLSGGTTIDGYSQAGAMPNGDPHISNAVIFVQIRGHGYHAFNGLTITSPDNQVRGLAFFELYQSIHVYGPDAHGNVIAGNFIGTDALGVSFSTNDTGLGSGIQVEQGASRNRIGGPTAADRNVISGNGGKGVALFHAGTDSNLVINNIVGLNPAGTEAVPNFRHGVDVNYAASKNRIGGADPSERNVISGNGWSGVEISHGVHTTGNQVMGNFIGTNISGTRAAAYTGNESNGITLNDGVSGNLLTGNVIGGNAGGGIDIHDVSTIGNRIRDNHLGISLDGSAIPNGEFGVRVSQGAAKTIIGPSNLIVNNGVGVLLLDANTRFNTITQNSIYANSTLGIDLEPLGVNGALSRVANGANQGIAAPTIAAFAAGTVTGSACVTCTVELFRDTPGISPAAQGKSYITSVSVSGSGAYSTTIGNILQGHYVTATATDTLGNTSEFSLPIRADEQVGHALYLPRIAQHP